MEKKFDRDIAKEVFEQALKAIHDLGVGAYQLYAYSVAKEGAELAAEFRESSGDRLDIEEWLTSLAEDGDMTEEEADDAFDLYEKHFKID